MRSLALALLEHEGTNPAQREDERDRPWRENLQRATTIRADWRQGQVRLTATTDLLAALRTATPSEASQMVVRLLNQGIHPASVWDGLFLGAGELLMRQPGIVGLHTMTTMNALHYAFTASGQEDTQRMLLLQGAAFLPLFRKFMEGRGRLREDLKIDSLPKTDLKTSGPGAIEEILAEVSKDRVNAARKTLALLSDQGDGPEGLMAAARRLIFLKGTDAHDYKFSSAALEDYYHTTPAWRGRYLAASLFWLRGSSDPDNGLIKRTREALGKS